jgi:hypothetical protein
MQSLGHWQWAKRRAGWALALLLGVLAAPAAAQASCGDYVRMGGADAPRPATDGKGMPSHPAPGPCHGPGCDRHPVAPLAPVTVSVQVEDWACVLRADDSRSSKPTFALREENTSRPVRRASSVYHPPRLLSVPASV